MSNKQKIFFIILFIIWLLLMIWCFVIKDYKTIIRSLFVLVGSFMFGIIFANLGND